MSATAASGSAPSAFARVHVRSTAVLRPLKLKSRSPFSSGALRSACVRRVPGSATARSLPLVAQPIDHRPARIAEPEQLRHLVVRLPRRVVARAAEELVAARRARRGTGWCGRPRRRGRPRAAAARRSAARATRCGRRGGARRRSAARAAAAAAFANDTPTSSEPTSPGPCVTATAPRSAHDARASASARSTTPQMSRMCWREASSGTTPPHSRWIGTCEATTFERIAHGRAASPVSSTTAADVSSHEVSMPRISIGY